MSQLPVRSDLFARQPPVQLRAPLRQPQPVTVTGERNRLLRNMAALYGTVITVLALILFVAAADRAFSAGYMAPLLGVVWDLDVNAGGQWLEQGLLALVHSIPGAGPELLVLLTSLLAAMAIGALCSTLRHRGWSYTSATLVGLLVAIHPITLHLASCGQPATLGALAVGLLILAVDRASALSDAQSLMTLGLALALLFVTDPNALYIVMPVLAMMPWMLREMRDGISSAALFLILLVPSVVLIAALLAGSMVVGVAPETILRHWLAVLHGGLSEDVLGTGWLVANGGAFFRPLAVLIWLSLICLPAILVIILRVVISPLLTPSRRRLRVGTAILAVLLSPLAGAFAAFFWHQQSRESAMAVTLAAGCAWVMTVSMRRTERSLWLLAMFIGVMLSWSTGLLGTDADTMAWRAALLTRP